MSKGKPVLAALGPSSENGPANPLGGDDGFENLLADLGFELNKQAIMHFEETKGFNSRNAGDILGNRNIPIPGVSFSKDVVEGKPNPIAHAMNVYEQSLHERRKVQLKTPRPVYVNAMVKKKTPYSTELMVTSSECWNEERPFADSSDGGNVRVFSYVPEYEPTPINNPKYTTNEREREGPFPIGACLEAPVPLEWSDSKKSEQKVAVVAALPFDNGLGAALVTAANAVEVDAKTKTVSPNYSRKSVRVVVLGHGGIFMGNQLAPGNEQLLLSSMNWLLDRTERMPNDESTWQYPRLEMTKQEKSMWALFPTIMIPLIFLALGIIVFALRGLR